jgi:hypothetical protein
LPKKRSDEPAAEQREEIHAHHEAVEDLLRGHALALRLRAGSWSSTLPARNFDQDVAHPVEAETLAGLVADDEGNLLRQRGLTFV